MKGLKVFIYYLTVCPSHIKYQFCRGRFGPRGVAAIDCVGRLAACPVATPLASAVGVPCWRAFAWESDRIANSEAPLQRNSVFLESIKRPCARNSEPALIRAHAVWARQARCASIARVGKACVLRCGVFIYVSKSGVCFVAWPGRHFLARTRANCGIALSVTSGPPGEHEPSYTCTLGPPRQFGAQPGLALATCQIQAP